MRIAVVGAGAMGSIFGAGFTEGGHETVLVDVAAPLVEKLQRDGVRIRSRDGSERTVAVSATSDPASVGAVDEVVAQVRPEIWKKLVLNAATLPTAALTGMNAGALTEHALMRALVSETAREAVAAARALGDDIDAGERVANIHGLLERAGPTRGSMLQDFEAGRRTEIDVINGAVVKAADGHGVPVPLNRAFVALVKGWEATRGLGDEG